MTWRVAELISDRLLDPDSPPAAPRSGSAARDSAEGVQDCIRRLRPEVQRILRETYWEGKSGFEVAEETGLSAENVRQRLVRARGELRRCLEARRQRPERKDWKHASVNQG